MGVDVVVKIAGVGVITSVVCLVLKRADREDISMLAALAGLVIVLMMVLSLLSQFFTELKSVFLLG